MEINNIYLSSLFFKDYVNNLNFNDINDIKFITKLITLSKEFKEIYNKILNNIIINYINNKFNINKIWIQIELTYINSNNLYKMLIQNYINDKQINNIKLLFVLKYNFFNDNYSQLQCHDSSDNDLNFELNTLKYLNLHIINFNINNKLIKFLIIFLKFKFYMKIFHKSLLNNLDKFLLTYFLNKKIKFIKKFVNKYCNNTIYEYILPYCNYIKYNYIKNLIMHKIYLPINNKLYYSFLINKYNNFYNIIN